MILVVCILFLVVCIQDYVLYCYFVVDIDSLFCCGCVIYYKIGW